MNEYKRYLKIFVLTAVGAALGAGVGYLGQCSGST